MTELSLSGTFKNRLSKNGTGLTDLTHNQRGGSEEDISSSIFI